VRIDSGYACIRRYIYAQDRKPSGSSKKCPRWYMGCTMRTYFRRGPHLWGRRSNVRQTGLDRNRWLDKSL